MFFRLLSNHISPKDIQTIPFVLNLRKEKWIFVFIYSLPKQDSHYFLENLSLIVDHHSSIYENHIILGDFSMEPKNPKLASFMHSCNLYNLIKSNTCFKGNGSCIELVLANRKYCFKHTSTFERGPSDHHHLIYLMLETTSKKEESKQFFYHEYKKLDNANFQMDQESKLNDCPKKHKNFVKTFENVLNGHALNFCMVI